MDAIEAMLTRHSTRGFKSTPVPKETLIKILEAANRTPSTANTQPWQLWVAAGPVLDKIRQDFTARFQEGAAFNPDIPMLQKEWPPALKALIDQNRSERFKMMGIVRQDKAGLEANEKHNYLFFGAPAAVFICMERTLGSWSIFDIGALSLSICLAARNYGVDSIPALKFVAYPDILRKELQVPDNLVIVFGVALGYEDSAKPINQYRSYRRPVQEIVTFKGL